MFSRFNFVITLFFQDGFDKIVVYFRYHLAPALDNTPNIYDTPDSGYLHVINDQYELDHIDDNEVEHYTSRYISSNYEEINIWQKEELCLLVAKFGLRSQTICIIHIHPLLFSIIWQAWLFFRCRLISKDIGMEWNWDWVYPEAQDYVLALKYLKLFVTVDVIFSLFFKWILVFFRNIIL